MWKCKKCESEVKKACDKGIQTRHKIEIDSSVSDEKREKFEIYYEYYMCVDVENCGRVDTDLDDIAFWED